MNTTVDSQLTKEIEAALSEDPKNIPFEQTLPPEDSPLNIPVQEKEFPGSSTQTNYSNNEPLDAPEQEIGVEDTPPTNKQSVNIPDDYSTLAATAMLGMADNLLAVGSSYFVKIKKHEDFYDFDELIKIIDEQNQKNIKRLCLDKEDKELLTPLLAQVLKNKAVQLSPEQQLMGATATILIKKAQIVMEMRSENQILTSRMLDTIQSEKQSEAEQTQKYDSKYPEDEQEIAHFNTPDTTIPQKESDSLSDQQIDQMFDEAIREQREMGNEIISDETTVENKIKDTPTEEVPQNRLIKRTPSKEETLNKIPIASDESGITKTPDPESQKEKNTSANTRKKRTISKDKTTTKSKSTLKKRQTSSKSEPVQKE